MAAVAVRTNGQAIVLQHATKVVGGSRERMSRDGFLKTVERVLPRRDVEVTEATRAVLGRVYD